jgi:hypothetical protein
MDQSTLRSLTNRAVHAITCRTLCLVLVFLLQAFVGMRLLGAGRSPGLERCKVNCIRPHQQLRRRTDIRHQTVNHVQR